MLFNELIRANDDLKNKVLENTTISELSNQALAKYKTAAASDAGAADKAGEFKRGNKRFSGIVKATKKQFANDQKSKKPNDQGVAEGLDPDLIDELSPRLIVNAAKKIVPSINASIIGGGDGSVELTTDNGLNIVIGCGINLGSIDIQLATAPGTVISSGTHKGAITAIIKAVYDTAVKKFGQPSQPGTLTITNDSGHGVWQHIANKLGLEYGAWNVNENGINDQGVSEGPDNLSYIGNCTDDDVIEHIFGDATNFAQAVEEHGDEFTIDDLVVKYDPESDIHSFYYKKQGVSEGAPELLKAEMPLVRHIEQELADKGWQKSDNGYDKVFSSAMAMYRKFGNVDAIKKQSVAEDVEQQYLWHGSRQKIPMLNPRQSVDTGGAAGSNQNAIYATSDPKVAIAVGGLTTPDSDTAMFPNDPQIVLFSGKIRKGEKVYLHKLPFYGPDGKPQFVQGAHDREFYSIPGVKGIKPVEIKAVPVDKYLNLIRQATPADLELRKKNTKDGVAEGLDEAVGGNYLYHATSASGLKGMLSSGGIRSAAGPQAATSAQTKLPTVSVTRDWGYASGANAQTQMASIGRDAILVLDRNAIESNFKTLGTSQSTHIKGLSLNPYLRKDGEARSQNTDPMARANAKGKSKYAEPTAKAGGEFEEAVVVPKGALPLKGTMVGFWVNPKSELINDPAIMNDPRRLDMVRPNQFVKATHQQGVAEAKGPCWKGYKQVGMKKKSGKKVPNCVPVSEDCEQIMSAIINQILINEAVQNNRR